jgi:hypothetical protein
MNNSMNEWVKEDRSKGSDNLIQFLDLTDGDFTLEEQYRFALESIFRWTLRRDELSDANIVRAIKRVAMVTLEDV